MKHSANPVGLLLSGPTVLLLILAWLAVVALIAIAFHYEERLVSLGGRAVRRLHRGRALPTLWGLSAFVLIAALASVLFKTKVLALLGLLVLLAGFALLGIGTGAAAIVAGRSLGRALGRTEPDDFLSLCLGLSAFLLADFLPFVGWTVVTLMAASGLGAVVECLLVRRTPDLDTE